MSKSFFKKNLSHLIILFLLILIFTIIQFGGKKIHLEKIYLSVDLFLLPYYAFCSFYRMLAAYIISFFFSLIYGYLAATQQRLSKFMLPTLDILQSIPVLGFFPAVLYLFVNISGGSRIGVEMASIFLIFTGQAWNIAFGVYESISTIPEDSKEALDCFGLKGFKKFIRLYFPASIPKLIYNSILSWGGGWYFLIACEIIAVGPINYKLPGLGSFLVESTQQGEWVKSLMGLAVLISIIVLMHIFIWHPLTLWAEKFRYEFIASTAAEDSESFMLNWGKNSSKGEKIRIFLEKISRYFLHQTEKIENKFQRIKEIIYFNKTKNILKKTAQVVFFFIIVIILFKGTISLVTLLKKPWPNEIRLIPFSLFASTLRLMIAYLISLSWTIPLAIWVGENKKVAKIVTPLAEIGASIPATALFPFSVVIIISVFKMVDVAAIILILMGMQWYLLFNLISGVKTIPGELKEAAKSLGLSRWLYWRKVVLPAMYPSLITGSITAWGGGWNSLIVSEYIVYNKEVYSVKGIGALLNQATYVMGNNTMILLTLVSMISLIVFLNHFFWRRLYNFAIEKYNIVY